MIDNAKCGSLCTSVTVREHRASREQFINAMVNEKHLDNFWTPKHFGRFLGDIFG